MLWMNLELILESLVIELKLRRVQSIELFHGFFFFAPSF